MGIWEFIGSTAETVKRNAPPLKDACKSTYSYGSAAVNHIDRAVRVNGRYGLDRVGEYMGDDETRSKIRLYSTTFARNAGKEGIKMIPGGALFSDIVSKTIKDVERENLKVEKLKKSENKARTPQKTNGGPKSIGRQEKHGVAVSDENLYWYFM